VPGAWKLHHTWQRFFKCVGLCCKTNTINSSYVVGKFVGVIGEFEMWKEHKFQVV